MSPGEFLCVFVWYVSCYSIHALYVEVVLSVLVKGDL